MLEAGKCGIISELGRFNQFAFKTVVSPAGWEVGDVLVYFTNHVTLTNPACSGTRLVLGAQGSDAKATDKSKWSNLGGLGAPLVQPSEHRRHHVRRRHTAEKLARARQPLARVRAWEVDRKSRRLHRGRRGHPRGIVPLVLQDARAVMKHSACQ